MQTLSRPNQTLGPCAKCLSEGACTLNLEVRNMDPHSLEEAGQEEEVGPIRGPLSTICAREPLIVLLDLSHRLYPDPFSNASNESVARCARS